MGLDGTKHCVYGYTVGLSVSKSSQLREIVSNAKTVLLRQDAYHVQQRQERRIEKEYRKAYIANGRKHPTGGTFKTPLKFQPPAKKSVPSLVEENFSTVRSEARSCGGTQVVANASRGMLKRANAVAGNAGRKCREYHAM